MSLIEAANVFRALGHPVRLAIVLYLSRSKKGVVWEALWNAPAEYGFSVDIDTLNFHLTELIKANVVLKVKVAEGFWVYRLNPKVKEFVRLSKIKEIVKEGSEQAIIPSK